jgi:hypothetical protein
VAAPAGLCRLPLASAPAARQARRIEVVDGALHEPHLVEHRDPLGGFAIARDDLEATRPVRSTKSS